MVNVKAYNAEALDLFGLQTVFKLCHLPFLTVDDSLGVLALEGSSGTGKTTLVKRIGTLNQMVTGGKVGIFSADKAKYEDFIGCPIPDQDSGQMKMFMMPNSLATMETVLIDEANRASYDNQEKYLSLIASRIIDGFPVKCRYIYIAMNPIMSDGTDVYEGVQPLDKAFGERVMGLVRMPLFHELPKESQLNVMKASFNQVKWHPSEQLAELHKEFVDAARELYEEYKVKHTDSICEYIHKIQVDLAEQSKNSILIEARRAQFILLNILGTYALNTLYLGKSSLEQSALEALEISFPNRLWEQSINMVALKQAHNANKVILSLDANKRQRAASNEDGVLGRITELAQALESGASKEDFSKLINQKCPDIEADPFNHYCYAVVLKDVIDALTPTVFGKGSEQQFIKRQEYDRLNRIVNKITGTPEYEAIKAEGLHVKSTKGKHTKDFQYPWYVSENLASGESGNTKAVFDKLIVEVIGWYAHTLLCLHKDDVLSGSDFSHLCYKLGIGYRRVRDMFLNHYTKV